MHPVSQGHTHHFIPLTARSLVQASFFLGEVGAGSKMKLVVNMVMGEMMCALGEGIHLADRSALDPATLVEILGLGAMACPLVTGKGPAMAAGGPFPTAFPLKHQLKDVSRFDSAHCPACSAFRIRHRSVMHPLVVLLITLIAVCWLSQFNRAQPMCKVPLAALFVRGLPQSC